MSNVIEFPREDRGLEAAALLAAYSDRACSGAFTGAIVLATGDGGAEFQISIGDTTAADLLAVIGMLDVVRNRLVRIVEADEAQSD